MAQAVIAYTILPLVTNFMLLDRILRAMLPNHTFLGFYVDRRARAGLGSTVTWVGWLDRRYVARNVSLSRFTYTVQDNVVLQDAAARVKPPQCQSTAYSFRDLYPPVMAATAPTQA